MYTDNGTMSPTPETAATVRAAATALAEAGASVEEDRPAVLERTADLANNLSGADGRAWVRRLLRQAGTVDIHPLLRQRFDEAKAFEVAEFTALLEDVDRFRSAMLGFMEHYDVILCPTCAYPAPPHGMLMTEAMRKGTSYTSAYQPDRLARGGGTWRNIPRGLADWRAGGGPPLAGGCRARGGAHLEQALGGWQRPAL